MSTPTYEMRYCPHCATALAWVQAPEDSGLVDRLRCPACGWTHWNNPTPVLAAIVEYHGQILLARNALWKDRFFGLITGFMEAGESPEQGIAREVKEEVNLDVQQCTLVDVSAFLRMNQVLISYHVVATGEIALSPELSEYRLVDPAQATVWTTGTGLALQKWLRARGFEPQVIERYPQTSAQASSAAPNDDAASGAPTAAASPSATSPTAPHDGAGDAVALEVDAKGLRCPQPILRAKKALATLQSGQRLRVLATDSGSLQDFAAFARQTGNALIAQHTDEAGVHHFVLQRR
ncbi:hypothetical protein CLI92_03590 [Vandammella animalimorsus]|uniref:Nudix hydrolase domain-containing protein n=1 Tax=Vandammella animalimorsus TaxID=2029117 RepID=A0A2A2T7V0_9BURK|nr:hypothetical protein CK621_01355 [Vandammella animalimorsus]PAX17911.1 hypothetical protein CLI92_03590 [Vandammella animalimorsus]PAX20065.1 hypothetical protein CLI93_05015 [Vandammella animalimorsus]